MTYTFHLSHKTHIDQLIAVVRLHNHNIISSVV